MPAIFCTTAAAIVILPCAVSSASRAGGPTVVAGSATVDLDAELEGVILGFSRRSVELRQTQHPASTAVNRARRGHHDPCRYEEAIAGWRAGLELAKEHTPGAHRMGSADRAMPGRRPQWPR